MSGMISVIGNLGADAEKREVNGQQVCNLRIGVRVGYGDRAVTVWRDVSVWGKPAEWAAELRKGDRVTVMGEMTAREHNGAIYEGIRAQSVTAHERRDRDSGQRGSNGGNGSQRGSNGSNGGSNGGWGGGQW
jgi:single-strand DNA-binding protein